jgi:hypothetical protein
MTPLSRPQIDETGKVLETKIGAEIRFRSRKPFDESCYLGNRFSSKKFLEITCYETVVWGN